MLNKLGKLVIVISILILGLTIFYQIEEKSKQVYLINNYEINYIKIPNVKILNVLVNGITEKQLNNNYACLEKRDSNIIIAGHGIYSVFKKLSNIQNNDIIILSYDGKKEKYYVTNKYIVNIYDFDYFKEKNSLILITCLDDNNRLIVTAKKMA